MNLKQMLRQINESALTSARMNVLGSRYANLEAVKEVLNKSDDVVRTDLCNRIIQKVEELRTEVERARGSYKYSSCYDDCIEVVKICLSKSLKASKTPGKKRKIKYEEQD